MPLMAEDFYQVDNDLDAYQRDAVQRKAPHNGLLGLAVLALGVAGEAGEVADEMKKVIGHGHPLNKEKFKKEIGDVLWYIAVLSHELGFALSEIAEDNTEKLRARYGEAFSTERSINRV